MHIPIFSPADILLPHKPDWPKWSVIACDQHTSDADGYWLPLERWVADAPSTLRLMLPEAYLPAGPVEALPQDRIGQVNQAMDSYLHQGIFDLFPNSYIYLERTLSSGGIRRGLVGKVDLEQYDYRPDSTSPIRPTEGTVESRLPVRAALRKGAALELPHILALADDPTDSLCGPLEAGKGALRCLYSFTLTQGGGQVTGYLADQAAAEGIDRAIATLDRGLSIAVGDGNHSLAAAKLFWAALKPTLTPEERETHPARFALVELGTIQDPSLQFEPIHRVMFGVDTEALLEALKRELGASEEAQPGFRLGWLAGGAYLDLWIPQKIGGLAVGLLQPFLDRWLAQRGGLIDYIHGEEETVRLAGRENTAGLLLPAMEKTDLFPWIRARGALPRKTFSMGEAQDKRYYLECRKIR